MKKKKSHLVISLMGVDGSGKTTLSKKLNFFFKSSTYLHLKPYILLKDKRTVVLNPHKQKKSTKIVSLLRLLSWLVSYKVFFLQSKKKKIYIFDRYAHDILIDPLRYRHNLSKNLTRSILNFFPEPDLWIFLKPSLKTIKSRKRELSDIELKHQIKKYSIFFNNKKSVLMLDTNNQSKILVENIKKRISYL